MKKKTLVLGIVLLTATCVAGFWIFQPKAYQISPEKYEQILEEVMSVDFPYQNVIPDNAGSMLAYVHATEQGRGLFLLDLKTSEKTPLPVTNEITTVAGWSPDDRHLAFIQQSPFLPKTKVTAGNTFLKEEWITVYDQKTKKTRRLTKTKNTVESRFVWLSTNSFLYVGRKFSMPYAEVYFSSFTNKAPVKIAAYQPILDNLVPAGNNTAAYTDKGEIFLLDFASPTNSVTFKKKGAPTETKTNKKKKADAAKIDDKKKPDLTAKEELIPVLTGKQISKFSKAPGFAAIKWLRYDKKKEEYLFCAVPKKSNWRYLYSYNPKTSELKQLTRADTYNGQYLEGGTGFTYVGNTNFLFFLAVRPEDASGHTNLFMGGGVRSYAASPKGDKIFAVATPGIDPEGIWEYDLPTRKLRLVADGFSIPFKASRVIEPQGLKITSFDGLEVPCFYYPPLDLVNQTNQNFLSTLLPGTKYPAVIYTPPATAAHKRIFNARVQLLSNLGFHVLAMNYRGCEGYGAQYASMRNDELAAEDVFAGYEFLSQNPHVDLKRMCLASDSDGASVIVAVLAAKPELWRAVSIENPAGFGWEQLDPSKLPPVFFSIGDHDASFGRMKQFEAWAKTNNVSVSSVVYTNSGHITYKTAQRKDKLDRVAKFLISHSE